MTFIFKAKQILNSHKQSTYHELEYKIKGKKILKNVLFVDMRLFL